MSLPSYPLVPAALGSGYAITLGEVSQASAWALGAGEFPVTFRISGVGWLVFGPRGYLGVMTPELTERYPDMMRIFRSGFAPTATAVLAPLDDGSGRMNVITPLPAPPFLVPVGRASGEVLAQGAPIELDLSLTFNTPCQVLVDLQLVGPRVVALFNGHLLGGVATPPPALVSALGSRRLSARAFVAEGRGFLDIDPSLTSAPMPALRTPDPVVLDQAVETDSSAIIVPTDSAWLESPHKKR